MKKRKKSFSVTRHTRKKVSKKLTPLELEMEEHLIRCAQGEKQSIIHVGSIVESTLRGPFGAVLKALTAGRIDMELQSNKEGTLSAERVLGRCEMGSTLWHDLETFVHEKDAMLRPLKERSASNESVASEPEPEDETALA